MNTIDLPPSRQRQTRAESREATRDALVESAIELYAAHGVSPVSLTHIAEHAGYSRGAFHSNFRDKDELHGAVVESVVAAIAPTLNAVLASARTSTERLGWYIRSHVEFCAENPHKAQALIAIVADQARAHPGSYERRADDSLADLVSLFSAGQAAGEMRTFDPVIMALTLRSTLDAHSMRLRTSAPQAQWQRLADEIATTFQLATRKPDHD